VQVLVYYLIDEMGLNSLLKKKAKSLVHNTNTKQDLEFLFLTIGLSFLMFLVQCIELRYCTCNTESMKCKLIVHGTFACNH
jgi:hypothetical protein